MMSEFPSFEDFFAATHSGRKPFPWQSRLARTVAAGGWPEEIGVPTGMGKTTCLDIAVWALAWQHEDPPSDRHAPTRIWYVVDRRLLVDAAFEHANFLNEVLAEPEGVRKRWPEASDEHVAVLTAVGNALERIAVLGVKLGPLHVVRLRGGTQLGARPLDPSQPTLILATVAMFASRLLLRGYGTSASMRPVDAALAGMDSLVLLDEAHLSRPLMKVCRQMAESDLGDHGPLLPQGRGRPTLVALTATGDRVDGRFDLDDDDRQHDVIRRRLAASKPTQLVETTSKNLAATLAEHALDLIESRDGSACVVFCNTAALARVTKDHVDSLLRKRDAGARVVLLTGRMRDRESERASETVLDRDQGAPSGRDHAVPRSESLIVVATQTLEVGADLDFDFLVTQCASVRALIQRFGRLNRLGECLDAQAVIVHPTDAKAWPPYGDEPESMWRRLIEAGDLDLKPESVAALLGKPADAAERTGELLPDHVWELAKTGISERRETPPEVFFDALEDEERDVSVCWRAFLPPQGTTLLPPVRQSEAVEIPRRELVEALRGRDMQSCWRLGPDRTTLEPVDIDDLRPGDGVVLPADAGLYDQDGWNPTSRETVLDVSWLRDGLLWLDEDTISRMVGAAPAAQASIREQLQALDPDLDVAAPEDEVARAVLYELKTITPHPWLHESEWQEYLEEMGKPSSQVLWDPTISVPYLARPRARRRAAEAEIASDASDSLSLAANSTALAEHLGSVGELCEKVAKAIGLPDDLVRAVRQAGLTHDLGKHEARFQRWMNPEGLARPTLAKSNTPYHLWNATRIRSGWPAGGRHELLSARLLSDWLANTDRPDWDWELVLHLVASHHGYGRPLVPPVSDGEAGLVSVDIEGTLTQVSGDLSVIDWEQPRRFRRLCEHYGVWGLCLLEAIVRQADHTASGAVGEA